ncbi:NAD-dependent succinate-semialdehyde dehydrogenase [Ornithinimicrobium sp. Arc0846-15]|nr:NAD-dependent succinate-semialdehyde dehydrogenase [Ornithinimicrobium laminariae]
MEYAVTNPATGEVVETYPTATDEQAAAALDKAADAFPTWSKQTSREERARLISRVAEIYTERLEELADLIVLEMGKPREEAVGEIELSAAIYQYYADNAEKFLADEPIELLAGTGDALIRRSGIGTLLGIMPWNFPMYQIARFAAPNLVLGNTILLKPAPECPRSAAVIEQIFHDAGLPEGAYVNVLATIDQVSTYIADPRIQGISLTGSERAGSSVAEQAGKHLKKVVLELGGSDPFIVLSTNDMDATVEAAVGARAGNTGQACNGGKRMIVVEDLYDEFLEKFNAAMKVAVQTPMVNEAAAKNLAKQVDTAVEQGATLTSGDGERKGAWFPGGVLTDITPDDDAFTQELFGPVAMVFKAANEEDAVELANNTPFGLGSYVFTTDAEQAQRVADQIEAGMVFINGIDADGAELPFGGVKRSGFGRELGKYGIEEFVNKKLIRTVE